MNRNAGKGVCLFLVAVLVMGLALVLGPAQVAQAATLCVAPGGAGGCYAAIQAAINAASSGDTINVAAGIYNESVTINKSLTLLGAQANVDPVATGRAGGESVIDNEYAVAVTANDVVFNGFEVRNFRYGINIPSSGFVAPNFKLQNITISYSWIHADDAWVGFNAEPGLLQNLLITHNIIHVNNVTAGGDAYALAAIGFSGGATANPTYEDVEISCNDLRNLSPDGGYTLFAGADPAAYLINRMVITCNRFRNVAVGANLNLGNILNGELTNNVFEDIGGTIGIDTGTISGNTFRNGGNLSLWGTEYGFTRPSRNVTVANNEFTDEVFGRGLRVRTGALADTIAVHSNAFRNAGIAPVNPDPSVNPTGYLLVNFGIGTVDATGNWWGSASGPTGNAGGLFGLITTSPWITAYIDDPARAGPPGCWPLSPVMTKQPGLWPLPPTPTPVPTLSEWGMLILAGLVVVYSVWSLRRRALAR